MTYDVYALYRSSGDYVSFRYAYGLREFPDSLCAGTIVSLPRSQQLPEVVSRESLEQITRLKDDDVPGFSDCIIYLVEDSRGIDTQWMDVVDIQAREMPHRRQ